MTPRNPPTDPDGDSRYEDVNGTGKSEIVDVQALFTNQEIEVVQENSNALNFNGDWTVSVGDIRKLFTERDRKDGIHYLSDGRGKECGRRRCGTVDRNCRRRRGCIGS